MPEVLDLPEIDSNPPHEQRSPALQRPAYSLFAYGVTIFLSAALLFQVQLIFAKHILPLFGGVPSVWNTCMFCFQVLLLLGYGYAHLLKSRLTLRRQRAVHVALLISSAVLLVVLWFRWGTPLTPGNSWKPGPHDNPVVRILEMLGLTVAFPFFLVSTTGPLMQSWAAGTRATPTPYRLYALSNAGSLLGLLTYPFLIEWLFTIRHQAWLWSSGYLLFVASCLIVALRLPKETAGIESRITPVRTPAARPKAARYALWLAFSTCSTIVLLSSTNFLCENIAAIPLLWVLPLALYLITFIIAFDSSRWYSRKIFWPLYAIALGIILSVNVASLRSAPLLLIVFYCLTIFAVCMVCHGELGRSKPAPEYLTSFYWTISAGGALGGAVVILFAPMILPGFWEFQGSLLAVGFLLFGSSLAEDRTGRSEAGTWPVVLVILTAFLLPHVGYLVPALGRYPLINREYWTLPVCLAVWLLWRAAFPKVHAPTSPTDESLASPTGVRARSDAPQFAWQPMTAVLMIALFSILFASYVLIHGSDLVLQERNFFGVKYVSKGPDGLALISGNTAHGLQLEDPATHYFPTLYYSPRSGVGTLLRTYPRETTQGQLRIGVIGMGIASLSAYARSGDYLRFYEIDPAIVSLSVGPHPLFSMLEHSPATKEIILGDGRISLERELDRGEPGRFDVLVVDAFHSDSIPVHLVTRESLALYQRHLRGPDGVIAFNVTNRFLDLAPVLLGEALVRHLAIVQVNQDGSSWILLSANPSVLQTPGLRDVARPPAASRPPLLWTDDYSNVSQVFRDANL